MSGSMESRAWRFAPYGLVLVVVLAGCRGSRVLLNAEHLDEGLVIVLPGIDGRGPYNEAACAALSSDRPGMAIELYDWTVPLGPVYNQGAYDRNRQAAAGLARRIAAYRRTHAGRPVFLVGHSGGTAIAAWAAEALPDTVTVDGIVLLASSLSPSYDLSRALARSRNGIVSFCSRRDVLLLDAGTRVVGTMDRKHTPAAGLGGFQRPAACSRPEQYGKLFQIEWDRRAAAAGHDGGHFSCLGERFVAAYVLPLLAAGTWDRALVADLREGRQPALIGPPIALAPAAR